MRISYNWLKDYVDVKMPPEKLAERLTMSGLSVESIQTSGNDHILSLEVTSNRPDALSVIGVAREAAALTGRRLRCPKTPKLPITNHHSPFTLSIKVDDKALCPRYTARVIRDVEIAGSPDWLKSRLEAVGLKSVNNVVDITNFCLFETGEPMHAFDLDKISGGELVIRKAKKGEKIITIDGVERILDDSILVIADGLKPIAIAGVMGGLDTEVTTSTKNLLLEAAYFDPVSIRRVSRKLGLATESSYRFERKVDIENILHSSDRAASLICEMAGGRTENTFDIRKKRRPDRHLILRYSRLKKVLGLEIPMRDVKSILNALGLKAKRSGSRTLRLEIPSFRYDLEGEIDVIEDIVRIYGYGKVPLSIPRIVEGPTRVTAGMMLEKKIREVLTGQGFDEIITYSLLSRKALAMSDAAVRDCVEINNPLSGEQELMRPSLMPGMLTTIVWNINRKTSDLKLFELGAAYVKEADNRFSEKRHLSIGITGRIGSGWDGRARESWFVDLAGALERVLSELGINGHSYNLREEKDARFSPAACASVETKGEKVGIGGEISHDVLENFDIKEKVYMLELNVDALARHASLEKRFQELPQYPSVSRDISIVVAKEITNSQLTSSIVEAAGPILKDLQLVDRYSGKQIPDGKLSLTYRLEYNDSRKTLEEKDVLEVHSKVLSALENKFGAKLR